MRYIIHDKTMKSFHMEAEVVKVTNTIVFIKPVCSMNLRPVTHLERKNNAVAFSRTSGRLLRNPYNLTVLLEAVQEEGESQ